MKIGYICKKKHKAFNMKQLVSLNSFFLSIIFLSILSCNTEPLDAADVVTVRDKDYILKLGEKLENPYSVTNMKRALDSVKSKMKISKFAKSTSEFDIETSHLYVKIEPKNAAEEALLKRDTSQTFFDYPLDYEFPKEVLEEIGTNNADSISSYYVAVPKDYVFPAGIKTEILEKLYIPEQDPYFDSATGTGKISKSTISSKEDLLGNLLIEAYKLTHNEAQLGLQSTTTGKLSWWIFGKKWRPSGNISMYDNTINKQVPVEGAQVLIRQWFTVDSGITDANGNFSTGTVRGKAKYILQWERYDCSIRNGWFGQAETKSDYEKDDSWNFKITEDKDLYFATIHQAAHDYYYKDILGLSRPQRNSFFNRQMKIAACDVTGSSYHSNQIADWGILPAISILQYRNPSQNIYGTTIHELAHSAHQQLFPSSYNDLVWKAYLEPEALLNYGSGRETLKQLGAGRVMESWARCVEIVLTNLRYQRLGYSNFEYNPKKISPIYGNFQYEILDKQNYYTPALFDLIDNINQRNFRYDYPQDNVTGFTIKEVQDIVQYSNSWGELKEKCKAKHPEKSTSIDELLSNWQ
jgi:hypothetical protein